jgi:hypothetical protein
MPLISFRLRSLKRDAETDRARFDKLCEHLESLRNEIAREAAGLQGRLSDATRTAASAQADLENELDLALSAKVDDLTRALLRYSNRICSLEAQLAFFMDIEKQVTALRDKLEIDAPAS